MCRGGQRGTQRRDQPLHVHLLLVRETLTERDGGVDQFGLTIDHRRHQPGVERRAGVPDLAEQAGERGALLTDRAGQHPGVAAAGVQPQGGEARVESRAGGGEAHVAGEREIEPRPHGGAVDRRDSGQWRVTHPQESLVDDLDVVEGPVGRAAQRRQLGARAERAAGAGQHDATGGLVALGAIHRRVDRLHERGREDVTAGRVVQRHHRDAAPQFERDQVIRHADRLPEPGGAPVIGVAPMVRYKSVVSSGTLPCTSRTESIPPGRLRRPFAPRAPAGRRRHP